MQVDSNRSGRGGTSGWGSGSGSGSGSAARSRSRSRRRSAMADPEPEMADPEPEPEPQGVDPWPEVPLRPEWLEWTRMWQQDPREAKMDRAWREQLWGGHEHRSRRLVYIAADADAHRPR
jgi:hypothetical protein